VSYKKAIDQWHAGRVNGLKKEHGWLSLVALDWLTIGQNRIASIGIITIAGDSVTVQLNPGTSGTRNGKPFTSGTIAVEEDRVIVGSKAFTVIQRGGKYAVRIWDSETPARKQFTGIDRYPIDVRWRITAQWKAYDAPKKVEIPTVIPDLVQEGFAPGVAVFMMDGKECRLEPTIEEGSDELFFVFGDRTNGRETYGAGRFLYTALPVNGTVVLDFNRSYNPPCVFTDFATCPVPSPQNRLPVRIEAGEKKFSGQGH
jgi:uncharacterized protein (DUF1684 family)